MDVVDPFSDFLLVYMEIADLMKTINGVLELRKSTKTVPTLAMYYYVHVRSKVRPSTVF
jgi:hypothetical protein